jgi:type VI secretion system FHA domain protein
MALRLQIISRHRQSLGDRGVKEFGRDGGTIGRSLESDWVLPDGQRYISSRHASIDFRSGSYYIVDTSTNGVYVNESEQPVGRGNPQRLFSGDRVRLGEYEMTVEIEEMDNTGQQLADVGHVDPVVKAQRVPPPDPTRADLVQAHEITAVGIEMLLQESAQTSQVRKAANLAAASLRLEDDPPQPKQAAAAAPAAAARPDPPPVSAAARVSTGNAKPAAPAPKAAAGKNPPAPTPATPPAASAPSAARAPAQAPASMPSNGGAASSALDAFFRGAGLTGQRVDERQAEQTLTRLGQLMREMIVGLNESLHMRADQKNVLRVPNTTIQPQNNNPLKFSASVDEALTNLLFRDSSEYLPAVEAVREAFTDIKQHQQVVLAAMRIAVADYIGRLDPDELENKFTNGKRGGLMSAANKLKYWDLYKDLYQVVTQGQQGQMPQQFLEEMARAYEHESTRAGGAPSSARKPQPKAS